MTFHLKCSTIGDMNEKVLKTLEYHKIISRLEEMATSDPGRRLCRELVPSDDIEKIRADLEETSDACDRIRLKGPFSFGDVYEMQDSLARLRIHGSLGMAELLHIGSLLNNVSRAITYGAPEKDSSGTAGDVDNNISQADDFRITDTYFSALIPLPRLAREITRCIISEDEMADTASPELADIRRKMKNISGNMHNQLDSILNSHREYLMDPVVTMRDGTYCLPVRIEYRNKVPGVIHDQSATGSTLFIEPTAVIKLNNDLRELEAREKQEISRILEELSSLAAPDEPSIHTDIDIMAHLDFVFAKAKLAGDMKATCPEVNPDKIIELKDARHPLLDPAKVVPINISLGDTYDLLVITGPNTGGKTVSLKTVGLLTLMAQAGLHIPAFDGSRVSVFKEVFADIGDEQSIEQSLSTFSGHMKNIVEIVDQADGDSLCLFDELGAGTDPTEGAALAIAVLSFLHRMQVRTIATTHYAELKVFALTTAGVENAACEFDVSTLRPTYRILIGVPGKSNAFAISKKLGLPQFIIDEAGEHIEKDAAAMEDLIAQLEKDRIEMERDKAQAEALRKELEELKKKQENQEESTEARREKILQKAREEAARILSDAKETADTSIRQINKIAQDSGLGRELEKERERIRASLKSVESDSSAAVKKRSSQSTAKPKPKELKKGDKVHIISMNLDGIVSSLPNEKGNFFVQMGILRSQVNINDVALVDEPEPYSGKKAGRTSFSGGMKSASISPEINLIGKNVDEACSELDKYLDDALLSHLNSVRIIHGRGTGALKNGIHAYLKRQSFVKSYHLAEFDDGGDAITVVQFK
jgi:DNA mismatch repair protein MutS2